MKAIEQWRAGTFAVEADKDYANPFLDVTISARFTGPAGQTIEREAYWDGDRTFRISFAPTDVGTWSYTVSGPLDSGLDGLSGQVECVPYSGDLDIYKHGFLRVSDNKKHLCHADGTPFFWLGDTHWGFAYSETLNTSNDPRMACMFRGMADKRKAQRFTVYQTNLRHEGHRGTPSPLWRRIRSGNARPYRISKMIWMYGCNISRILAW